LMSLYRRASQFVAIPAVSVGLLFAFFPREVMLLWTHNSSTADNTQDLVRILVTGSTLGALMFIPYTLQLVFGFTRLLLLFNCASVVVLVPTTVLLVRSFGMPGAAFVSIILYSCQISFLIPLMHRRSLLSEARSWYLHGLLTPCLVTAAILVLAKSVIPPGLGNLPLTMILVLLLATTMLATLLMAPQARFAVLSSANGLFDVTRARRGIRRNRGDR
jgi:O-antigen/teichoic acid export membrane protein